MKHFPWPDPNSLYNVPHGKHAVNIYLNELMNVLSHLWMYVIVYLGNALLLNSGFLWSSSLAR